MTEINLKEALISLTDRCPLACKHCFSTKNNPDLSKEQIFEILFNLKEMGIENIILLGGEPTIREDFTEILDYSFNIFKNVTVETNGVLKTNFYNYPSCNICVSFEYPEKEKNDEIRVFKKGKKSHFESALKKVKVLHNPKILRFTLYQDSNVFKSLVMADMYGCNSIFFPLIPMGSGKSLEKNCPDAKKIAETLKIIEEFNRKSKFHHELALPQTYLYDKNLYLKFAILFMKRGRICQAGLRRIYINVTGDIYPCAFVPVKIGNIFKNNAGFINEKLYEFNEKMADKKLGFPCSECFFKVLCNGGCYSYHYNKKTKQQENCPINFLIKNYKEEIKNGMG